MGERSIHTVPPGTVLVVMGVSGCGKTTVARALADRLGLPFLEGDSRHPAENVAKMAGGTPLSDADRWPWLAAIAAWIDAQRAAGKGGVVTCSALKRAYRSVIIGERPDVRLVHLDGDRETIAARLAARTGHFMPPSLLASQFDALEQPSLHEHPITVDVTWPVEQIVDAVVYALVADR
jgi:carbohydrate kinase (thermoresistant glucokinase family)